MDQLLAEEQAIYRHVVLLQEDHETPFQDTLAAFEKYRKIVQEIALTDIAKAEKLENRLWERVTVTRKQLTTTLTNLRETNQKIVESRVAAEIFLRFLRHNIRFYRAYISALAVRYGGIPELEVVAHRVSKNTDANGVANTVDAAEQMHVLSSCHRTLIYLGDLYRYRATYKLDSKQDYGPATGYYDLACTIKPEAGRTFNGLAAVANEQNDWLKLFYFFYRSLLAAVPVEQAKGHLKKNYKKAEDAWEKGELIARGPPGDPFASEKTMIGWFIRLHSVCFKGETVRGYDEILRELTTRLKTELQSRPMDGKLLRMVVINIAAQQTAMDQYTGLQTSQHEHAFYYSLHINLVFFTALLDLFLAELASTARRPDLVDAELAEKLTPVMIRILPALRLYSNWLLLNSYIVVGLTSNDFIHGALNNFWQAYAQALDVVASVFPIFDLEDCEQVTYLLEEDADLLGFKPLEDSLESSPVHLTTHADSKLKPRFSDASTQRLSISAEMLSRMYGFLYAGSHVANNIERTPVFIRGTRFSLKEDINTFTLPRPPTPPPPEPVKQLSYAAMAAKAQAEARRLAQPKPVKPAQTIVPQNTAKGQAHHLERMVDSLIEDDDTDHPVTPPSLLLVSATVIEGTDSMQLDAMAPPFSPKGPIGLGLTPNGTIIPATASAQLKRVRERKKEDLSDFNPRPKLQGTTASLWSPSGQISRPQSTSNSPSFVPRLHQRGNSSTSIRSVTSPKLPEGCSPSEGTGRQKRANKTSLASGIAATGALQQSLSATPERAMASPQQHQATSPLLFGGSSIWTPSKPKADD